MADLERMEVYLDGLPQPYQVLTLPPYRLSLETAELADGEHRLHVVAVYRDGQRKERVLSFTVDNPAAVQVRGLVDGETIQGTRELSFDIGDIPEPEGGRHGSTLLRIISALVVLGGVWALFAFLSPVGNILRPITARPSRPEQGGAPSLSQATMQQGEAIFAQQCASCHGRRGEGVPGMFPPLAANSHLESARDVVSAIHDGRSGPLTVKGQRYDQPMPPFAQLTPQETAAVATYVRNSFGNSFGGISEQQARQVIAQRGPAAAPVDKALLSAGHTLYRQRCVVCHQESGGGIPGANLPPLANNPHLGSVELIAHAIRGGQAGPILVNGTEYNGQMPPTPDLSAEQVAALTTYVRNSFGNSFGGASVEEVRRALAASDAGAARREGR